MHQPLRLFGRLLPAAVPAALSAQKVTVEFDQAVAIHFTEGTLAIDMRDPRRHELVWRAVAVEDNRDSKNFRPGSMP